MPKKTRRQAPVKSKQPAAKAPRIGLGLTLVLMVTVVVAIAICSKLFVDYRNAETGKRKMQIYLQDKYKKEFVVKNYRIEGGGLGVEGDPTADAYAKDDPRTKFEVWDYGRPVVGPHSYGDGYISAVWGKEYKQKINKRVSEIAGETVDYETSISFSKKLLSGFDFSKGVPRFMQYADSPEVSMRVSVFSDTLLSARQVWLLLNVLRSDGIHRIHFHICTKGSAECYNIEREDVAKIVSLPQLEAHVSKLERY